MGMKMKETGGGPATGLANDFVSMLQGGLSGSFGAGAPGHTVGVMGVLNDILSGGAGQLGGSMADMIARDTERQAQTLRSHFGSTGGMGFGTPAAYAESMFRAEAAPKATQAIGQMQMNAISQLLPIFAGISQMGIPQRQQYAEPSGWQQGFQTFLQLADAAAKFIPGGGK